MSQKNNGSTRRNFLKRSLMGSIPVFFGIPVLYSRNLEPGLQKYIVNQDMDLTVIPGKSDQLIVLNDRPVNAETPSHLLDDDLTPNELFFVRNNGIPPQNIDPDNWTIEISGESVKEKKVYSLNEIKETFKHHSYDLTLECGGNGRKEFNPPAKGNQWSNGAVGCAKWTGIKLKDLLNDVGIKSDAVYLGYYGADTHLSGDPNKVPISRGVPIEKALSDESLLAWSMNDQDIPVMNGHPVRLVFGGMPASCSGKWINKIVIRNKVHDGPKMGGQSYRTPCEQVAPGTKVADDDMCIIEKMPVKSLITYPKTGAMIKKSQKLPIRGHAWTCEERVVQVEYSIDYGVSWHQCDLKPASNRFAWQRFSAEVSFPKEGYYEVWARASDNTNDRQPIILPGWNPKGYLNNACHRIAVKVGA